MPSRLTLGQLLRRSAQVSPDMWAVTAELCLMGIEGAARLAWRREKEAIGGADQRCGSFEVRVAEAYENGSALCAAPYLEVDDVIDHAETQAILIKTLVTAARPVRRKSGFVDCW